MRRTSVDHSPLTSKSFCIHRLIEIELNQRHQPLRNLRGCALLTETNLVRVRQRQAALGFEIGKLFNQALLWGMVMR